MRGSRVFSNPVTYVVTQNPVCMHAHISDLKTYQSGDVDLLPATLGKIQFLTATHTHTQHLVTYTHTV